MILLNAIDHYVILSVSTETECYSAKCLSGKCHSGKYYSYKCSSVLIVFHLNSILLSCLKSYSAECHSSQSHFSECHSSQSHFAECRATKIDPVNKMIV